MEIIFTKTSDNYRKAPKKIRIYYFDLIEIIKENESDMIIFIKYSLSLHSEAGPTVALNYFNLCNDGIVKYVKNSNGGLMKPVLPHVDFTLCTEVVSWPNNPPTWEINTIPQTITFILCMKYIKVLQKDIYKIIAKQIYNSRYDFKWFKRERKRKKIKL